MPDKLSEVAKQLGQTKRNAEAAIRRYQAIHPRIERVRDVFDNVIPFEMEFETEPQDGTINIDLYFNKPPPLSSCSGGRYTIPCQRFEVGPGNHLLQVTGRYKPGSVVVFRDNVKLTLGTDFSEYDPTQGLVYIQGLSLSSVLNICYVRDTWITCAPLFVATGFYGFFSGQVGELTPNYDLNPNELDLAAAYGEDFNASDFTNSGATSHISNVAQSGGDSQAVILGLAAVFPEDIDFPPVSNTRITYEVSLSGVEGYLGSTIEQDLQVSIMGKQIIFSLNREEGPGLYVAENGDWIKKSSVLGGTITYDNNVERGSLIVTAPGYASEGPAYVGTIFLGVIHSMQLFGNHAANTWYSTATLSRYEIGCSMESP